MRSSSGEGDRALETPRRGCSPPGPEHATGESVRLSNVCARTADGTLDRLLAGAVQCPEHPGEGANCHRVVAENLEEFTDSGPDERRLATGLRRFAYRVPMASRPSRARSKPSKSSRRCRSGESRCSIRRRLAGFLEQRCRAQEDKALGPLGELRESFIAGAQKWRMSLTCDAVRFIDHHERNVSRESVCVEALKGTDLDAVGELQVNPELCVQLVVPLGPERCGNDHQDRACDPVKKMLPNHQCRFSVFPSPTSSASRYLWALSVTTLRRASI